MTSCKFFGQGFCRNGDFCSFIHAPSTSTGEHLVPTAGAALLNLNSAAVNYGNREAKISQNCRFFSQGMCNKGKECRYIHHPTTTSSQYIHPVAVTLESAQLPTDTRSAVPCRFLSRPGGCQKTNCPYLHVVDEHNMENTSSQVLEKIYEEDQEREDNFVRNLSGATVYFNEGGSILKVSFPTDFSLVYITGLVPGTTPEALVGILHEFGFNITTDCVRIHRPMESLEPKVTVKVEDPLLASDLSSKLKSQSSAIKALPIPIYTQQTNCRKAYISWHKSTRSVWVNFGSGDIANRVAEKFNDGRYKCLGQPVKSSTGKPISSRGRQRGYWNPLAWTIVLSDVPSKATSKHVEEAIKLLSDKPRHIELGPVSYKASDEEVSVIVRSCLEKNGPLESFYLAKKNKGKRVKAIALFVDEADARLACSLNNGPLAILGNGKLTITIIQTFKIKVLTAVYIATKSEINKESEIWKKRYLVLHVYPDTIQAFTTLKVEGSSTKDVVYARKTLDAILSGHILKDSDNDIWNPSLSSNGSSYRALKSIEKALQIIITRDKVKRQLRYYGPPEKYKQAAHQVTAILRDEETSTTDRVQQRQETALQMIKENCVMEIRSVAGLASTPEQNCPICFDDVPITPIQTLCKHTYCLECFENYCEFAASTSKAEFRIECQGDSGKCAEVFNLAELRDGLSSSAFELLLKSSFEEYVHRHPKDFHYCPTPDCDYVYRCTSTEDSKPLGYTCPNCLEPICTLCHAQHGDYTCAEYRDIKSGGYEALEKLKRELNIKDCPKCKTPIEKTEGCNHMTCGGCKAHICWVCMAVFGDSGPCYKHMTKEHGSIGLDALNDLVD